VSTPVLEIRDLRVEFGTYGGVVEAVRGVSLALARGKTLAIVGESGCGKSVTVQAAMGLIPTPPGRVTGGSVRFDGIDVLSPGVDINAIRRQMGMVFQSLNLYPHMTALGNVSLALRKVLGRSRRDFMAEARAALGRLPPG
jgi:polar amino acid transport system ATP-binding protein